MTIKPSENRALQAIGTGERNGRALTFNMLRTELGYSSRGAAINLAHKLKGARLVVIDKSVRPARLKLSDYGREVA